MRKYKMDRQKKILIAEASTHTKCLENLYHLLNNRCEITFYYNRFPKINHDLLFPSSEKAQVIRNRFYSVTFFVWLLFYGKKFDYINISTGPENKHFSAAINVIFFYICCLIYGKKIILTVRRVRPYLKTTPGFFSYLNSKSIKKLKRFTFETKTVRDFFAKTADVNSPLLGVSYDRYTDLLIPGKHDKTPSSSDGQIRLGLLGGLKSERRDYNLLCEILNQLTIEERSKLTFVVLGVSFGGSENEIIRKLSEYVKVDYIDGILSPEEFDKRGLSCDILISTLIKGKYDGKYNATGTIGDAIYLRKKVIIPSYLDEELEFEDISLYYRNSEELLGIFKKITELSKARVSDIFIEKFSTTNVFKGLVKDLKL